MINIVLFIENDEGCSNYLIKETPKEQYENTKYKELYTMQADKYILITRFISLCWVK